MAKVKTKTTATGKKKKARARPVFNLEPGRTNKTKKVILTQAIIDEVAATVRQGNFRYVARGKAGIPEGTWGTWLRYGRDHIRDGKMGTIQAKLVMALDKAENEVHSQVIRNVLALDPENPASVKIQMDYVIRRYGKLYSKSPNAHDDDTGDTFKVDPMELLAEKLAPYLDGD